MTGSRLATCATRQDPDAKTLERKAGPLAVWSGSF